MRRPKIVSRKAVPIGNEQILYLEKDKDDEVWCTIYKENCHMTQREIAKAVGYAEPVICDIVRRSLDKIFRMIKKKNKNLNPIELTALVGELLNVKTDVQYKRYFRSIPKDIKNEVINYAIEKKYIH